MKRKDKTEVENIATEVFWKNLFFIIFTLFVIKLLLMPLSYKPFVQSHLEFILVIIGYWLFLICVWYWLFEKIFDC